MSYLLTQAREQVKKLEEQLKSEDLKDFDKQILDKRLIKAKAEVEKYQKLELMDLDKIAAEMKIIKSHVKAVDDKYNCRTVKALFALAEFFDKPRSISKSFAKSIREYTMHKINAPVCSITGSPKPDIGDMPSYTNPVEAERLETWRRDREEIMKFRDISVNYLESKPTKFDRIKSKIHAVKEALK